MVASLFGGQGGRGITRWKATRKCTAVPLRSSTFSRERSHRWTLGIDRLPHDRLRIMGFLWFSEYLNHTCIFILLYICADVSFPQISWKVDVHSPDFGGKNEINRLRGRHYWPHLRRRTDEHQSEQRLQLPQRLSVTWLCFGVQNPLNLARIIYRIIQALLYQYTFACLLFCCCGAFDPQVCRCFWPQWHFRFESVLPSGGLYSSLAHGVGMVAFGRVGSDLA